MKFQLIKLSKIQLRPYICRIKNTNTLYLFTTSGGVTISCDKVLRKKLRVINRNIISGFIDNNCNFWLKVFNEVEKTFKELGAVV